MWMLTLNQNPNISTMFAQSRNTEHHQDVIYMTKQEVLPPFGCDMQSSHTSKLMQTPERNKKTLAVAHMAIFSAPQLRSSTETSQTLQKNLQGIEMLLAVFS